MAQGQFFPTDSKATLGSDSRHGHWPSISQTPLSFQVFIVSYLSESNVTTRPCWTVSFSNTVWGHRSGGPPAGGWAFLDQLAIETFDLGNVSAEGFHSWNSRLCQVNS